MKLIANANAYIIFQSFGFFASLLSTVIIIRGLGSAEYGHFSYYAALGDFLKVVIILGFDQSITRYKDEREINKERHDNEIFNAKLIVFTILLPFVFFIQDRYIVLSLVILMLTALFDMSYLHMERSSLKHLGIYMFATRSIYLVGILILNSTGFSYQYYFIYFSFISVLYAALVIFHNKINIFKIKLELHGGFGLLKRCFTGGFSRVYLFAESFLVLNVLRTYLSYEKFGQFMIIFNVAKLFSGFLGIMIIPYYKRITTENEEKGNAYKLLILLGFAFIALGFVVIYLMPAHYLMAAIKISLPDYIFRAWMSLALMYSLVVFFASVYMNIGLIASNRLRKFYISRLFYLVIVGLSMIFLLPEDPLIPILILIISELIIISYATICKIKFYFVNRRSWFKS